MRRALATGAVALLVLVPLAMACGDTDPTPTVASVDFTPEANLEVTDSGSLAVEVDGGGTDIASGSVLLVTNAGTSEHRLVGTIDDTQVFDTGTMEPGDETTIVLVPDGELKIADLNSDREVTVQMTPREES